MNVLDMGLALIKAQVRAVPDTWNYSEEEDMFILNMDAYIPPLDYNFEVDCIVAMTEESRKLVKWYWHTRTLFEDYEGYEENLEDALNKSMDTALKIIKLCNAKRLDPGESNDETLYKNEEVL